MHRPLDLRYEKHLSGQLVMIPVIVSSLEINVSSRMCVYMDNSGAAPTQYSRG
jgi:hypothetical protein